MNKVYIRVKKTENGYCGTCDVIDGFIVTKSGSFKSFRKYMKECIDFYLEYTERDEDMYERDEDAYDEIFDTDYKLVYKFNK